jgi:hypothetical protein
MGVALRGLEGARMLFGVFVASVFPGSCFFESARKNLEVAELM